MRHLRLVVIASLTKRFLTIIQDGFIFILERQIEIINVLLIQVFAAPDNSDLIRIDIRFLDVN